DHGTGKAGLPARVYSCLDQRRIERRLSTGKQYRPVDMAIDSFDDANQRSLIDAITVSAVGLREPNRAVPATQWTPLIHDNGYRSHLCLPRCRIQLRLS